MFRKENYQLIWWRPLFDILSCYALIVFSIYMCFISVFFYPLAVLVLANRILKLSLLSHEAIHGSLFKNYSINNFVGRWLCAFPTSISFSKYRKLHLLHHRALGNEVYDPDIVLYKQYPQKVSVYFFQNFKQLVTLKIFVKFIDYYTDINYFLFHQDSFIDKIKKNRNNGDFVEFIIFYILLFSILIYMNLLMYYIAFFCVPLLLITQPYVLLMGGLQHGPIQPKSSIFMLSRSIRGPKAFMEIVLPLDINFHSEHHYNPTVPHYHLRQFSDDLEQQGNKIWAVSYFSALKQLFN